MFPMCGCGCDNDYDNDDDDFMLLFFFLNSNNSLYVQCTVHSIQYSTYSICRCCDSEYKNMLYSTYCTVYTDKIPNNTVTIQYKAVDACGILS